METETIDKLFLELSQVTNATTARELALQAEIERLQVDAERYRYLRENHVREWVSDMPHNKGAPSIDLDFSAEGHDLDAAIDRAAGLTPNP